MSITFKNFSETDDDTIRQSLTAALSCTDANIELKRLCLKLGRPLHIVTQRAFQLGVVKYSEHDHLLLSHRQDGWRSDEVDVLIQNPNINRKHLAIVLNRSTQSVNKKFVEFNLKNEGATQPWELQEEAMLVREIGKTPLKKLCQKLMRNPIDVKYTAIKLGLAKAGVFKQFTGRNPNTPSIKINLPIQVACL
jgi:hypothetical protein